jgi:HEAT repeat protein
MNRTRLWIACLLGATTLALCAALIRARLQLIVSATPVAAVQTEARAAKALPPQTSTGSRTTPSPTSPTSDSASQTSLPTEDYALKRTAELMELATQSDPDSLNTILGELTNRDPAVRKAAVQAAVQFGSRDAIPKLTDALSQTDDVSERAAIQDAIEFLKLPSLAEMEAQQSATPAAPVSEP